MAPYTFSLFAPYNKNCALRLKNTNTRMFNIDIIMDKNEETGYFYKTIDLADGKYHYQYKIITKSWFEESPQPAKPTIDDEQENSDQTNEQSKSDNTETSATFTDIVYVFVDPYATEIDVKGTDDAHKSVGVLNIKDGKKITGIKFYINSIIKKNAKYFFSFLDNYQWKHDDHKELAHDDELIIYELHVSDFCGTFKDIINKIDHFKKLGINTT
jgi:1,4-alpha-glucan branching enzyme